MYYHPREIVAAIVVRLSEHIKLHLRKSKVFSLWSGVLIIALSGGHRWNPTLFWLLLGLGEKGAQQSKITITRQITSAPWAKPFQSEMHIKYRRIELCKGFIFWVAVSLKLLWELQCVKQEISPLKKKNSARLWTAQKKEVRTEAASAPAP